ncbi:MAG: hypothetical protein QCH96_05090 [Candidatus Thermoplasmatota archaeon]|nr:hypothetical protein [Candidatus Thermoplasmatota archaeon]
MRKTLILFTFILLLLFPLVPADNDDIVFTIDQKEYYFLTGQQAVIPLTINNTYGKDISGTMKYTITQEVDQNGFVYSSSNSNSQSYTVHPGNQTIGVNFGSSETPLTLRVSLSFSYTLDSENREVSLSDISIYFVPDKSQMDNQQDPQQATSEKITDATPSQNDQQQPQTPMERLQNSQMTQDSAALKDQIQQQLDAQKQQQEAFEQTLFDNEKFMQHHQDLLDQGYTLTEKQLDALNNDSGDFDLTYQNKQGETATVQGSMEDGEITDIHKQTAEDRRQMMEALNQSQDFKQYKEQLHTEGFNQTSVSFDQKGNKTTMNLTYQNQKNETATITAEFQDNELQDVTLTRQEEMNPLFWILPLLFVALLIGLFLYLRYKRRHPVSISLEQENRKEPFDHRAMAKRLLLEAEELYRQGQYKEAYAKAGQSLRLYLSYEHGICRELTNAEVIRFLKKKQYPYSEIKQCFDLCSLVEFAKYTANEKDFHAIRSTVGTIISV